MESNLNISMDQALVSFGARATIGPFSLQLEAGEVLGLVGPNGSGKTTLMRALTGLERLSSGGIRVLGVEVRVGRPTPGVGALIEEPAFYPWLSARNNLELAAAGRKSWLRRIESVLQTVALQDAANVPVEQFSQGMRQRLGIARVLLGAPQILILDEPTNGLDGANLLRIRGLIREHADAGGSAIVSSHMLGEIAQLADSVLVMNGGRPAARSTISDVLADHESLESWVALIAADTPR